MRRWLGVAATAFMVACYSPTALPGAPCTLELNNCPSGQRCEIVGGESVCVVPGSGRTDAGDDAMIDASTDSMIDAPIDGMTVDMMMPDGPATAMWTLVQHKGESNGNGVTLAASGAGHLLVVGVETGAMSAVTAVTDNAGNTYARANGSRAVNTQENFGVEIWYAANATAGATRIVAAANVIYGVVVWEVAGITSATPLGNTSKLDNQAATNTPDGAPITTTTVGEFVVSIVIVQLAVSNILSAGFTNDENVFMNGWAHMTSNTAPPGTYTAEWNATNGIYCASSAAFRAN